MSTYWNEFQKPVAIGIDASRFDQHQSITALKVEHEQWLRMVPRQYRNDLAWLLSLQEHNVGKAWFANEGVDIKYEVEGTRASGDMNTSSGNCFTMVMLVVTYMWSIGVKFRLANNGDDCVLIIEQADQSKLDTLPAWFSDMGFTMEIEEPVYILEQVVFC